MRHSTRLSARRYVPPRPRRRRAPVALILLPALALAGGSWAFRATQLLPQSERADTAIAHIVTHAAQPSQAAPSAVPPARPVSEPVQATEVPPSHATGDWASLLAPAPLTGAAPLLLGSHVPLAADLQRTPSVVAVAPDLLQEDAEDQDEPTGALPRLADVAPLPLPRPFELRSLPVPDRPRLAQPSAPRRARLALNPAAPPPDAPSFFEKLFGMKKEPSGPALAYATPQDTMLDVARNNRLGLPIPPAATAPSQAPTAGTAVYNIAARTVTLPSGERLEAHSGLGEHRDDPRSVHIRMKGATPPHTYDLAMREAPFHGVRAIRLNPVGGSEAIHGRAGLLAHTFMLGPNGDSNGCISFRNYDRFLQAYVNGEVRRLVVVSGT
ncbi:MAG: DUF2778 domain-containing protein [Alsobacter sp.]